MDHISTLEECTRLEDTPDFKLIHDAIQILRQQRARALIDIVKLHSIKKTQLQQPSQFVRDIKTNKLKVPQPQEVTKVPILDLRKYAFLSLLNEEPISTKRRKKGTSRSGKQKTSKRGRDYSIDNEGVNEDGEDSNNSVKQKRKGSNKSGNTSKKKSRSNPKVRSKKWTDEEHAQLEQLFIEFPPEEIPTQRWSKIAKALGTRTPRQVERRCKKYFRNSVTGKWNNAANFKKRKRSTTTTTTFMSSNSSKVMTETTMSETTYYTPYDRSSDDNRESIRDKGDSSSPVENNNSNNDRSVHYQTWNEGKDRNAVWRYTYTCDSCGIQPIMKYRWKCIDCEPNEDAQVDLCEPCYKRGDFKTTTHKITHQMERVKVKDDELPYYLDSDYRSNCIDTQEPSYLDSRYQPSWISSAS